MNSNIKGWSYRVFRGDLDSTVFGPFASLIDLWRQKSARGRYPEWRDFDLIELQDWWGRLSLADIQDDPFDIEFALWGTTLTEWWGRDYTRKKMSEAYENRQANWEKFEGPYFKAIIETDGIGIISGDLRAIDRGFISVQGIDLLLSKDGRVAQMLSGYRVVGVGEDGGLPPEPVWQL
jgi:hypothetical protein